MRIAQVAPLSLAVPPGEYGGTERVVYELTEALVDRGHDVTLFASGDSQTRARLVAGAPRALWQEKAPLDELAPMFLMHAEVFSRAAEFDVIHTHTDYHAFPYASRSPAPVLTTLHGRLDLPHVAEALCRFDAIHLVSISESQRAQVPQAPWAGTVYHGLALDQYRFDADGGEHLLFLGRLTPEKAPHAAIEIALAADVPLTLAGRIEPAERDYFEQQVEPHLKHPLVRYVGEVNDEEKQALLAASRALLFPIDWPEPFGLVMIEAMACGTPVIARPKGAASEVVRDGVTGILTDDQEKLVQAVRGVRKLDRAACRRDVEQRFSIAAMTDGYERIYEALRARSASNPG